MNGSCVYNMQKPFMFVCVCLYCGQFVITNDTFECLRFSISGVRSRRKNRSTWALIQVNALFYVIQSIKIYLLALDRVWDTDARWLYRCSAFRRWISSPFVLMPNYGFCEQHGQSFSNVFSCFANRFLSVFCYRSAEITISLSVCAFWLRRSRRMAK